ncbi:helix-turn-helix domain-containing protein [Klebsiella aerogenes]|uniref:helix-turn-helix domain-containing protein n=1 Tax=Klebsiella aerogenes TaxID=548 RepID=UPI00254D121F|nr:LuxR C-terminal-related transcriptional regulator [Klebsiella aerogenes]EKZ5287322.1 hypothetical protein [Klebsiella aerogenes]MDK7100998.1 LuxR C-terminal-related transcriptional regulator [Klebsiella aerogenes]MDK7645829.1 LuxR C-terminal-related transcriptional regulator [Klebsiella aerogenes]MDK7850931.1 LuxR C-terminal-related transcriptional regulator [Klebsiella aerogenes]
MRKILITDSYLYKLALQDIVAESYLIDRELELKNITKLTKSDCFILYIGNPVHLFNVYAYLSRKTSEHIIVALDFDLKRPLIQVNYTYFLSSNVNHVMLDAIINDLKTYKLHKKLTSKEESIVKLILDGYNCEDISKMMNLSIKTISLHKTNAKMKTGLLKNNDFTSFSLFKIIFSEWQPSPIINNNHTTKPTIV